MYLQLSTHIRTCDVHMCMDGYIGKANVNCPYLIIIVGKMNIIGLALSMRNG